MKEEIKKFNIEWGKISFDGSALRDIIFADGKVMERDYNRIRAKYDTSHVVDEDEAKLLLKGNPQEVVIGTGFTGGLKLNPSAEALLKQRTALIVMLSPQAVELLNDKLKRNIRVNALIHTTC